MARVEMIKETKATGKAKEIFADIKSNFRMVPNLFKTLALKPDILEADWMKVKAVMMQGELPRDLKEMIALVVSQANGCRYCVNAHGGALKMMGTPREILLQMVENIDGTNVPTAVKKVLKFSVKAAGKPNDITDSELEEIKDLGYSDAQIVELLSVVDLFTSFNKFLDSLQVEVDFPDL